MRPTKDTDFAKFAVKKPSLIFLHHVCPSLLGTLLLFLEFSYFFFRIKAATKVETDKNDANNKIQVNQSVHLALCSEER